MTAASLLPKRGRGRQNTAAEAQFQQQLAAFCNLIRQIRSSAKICLRQCGTMQQNRRVPAPSKTDFGFPAPQKTAIVCSGSGLSTGFSQLESPAPTLAIRSYGKFGGYSLGLFPRE
jgi:hypothetical protein